MRQTIAENASNPWRIPLCIIWIRFILRKYNIPLYEHHRMTNQDERWMVSAFPTRIGYAVLRSLMSLVLTLNCVTPRPITTSSPVHNPHPEIYFVTFWIGYRYPVIPMVNGIRAKCFSLSKNCEVCNPFAVNQNCVTLHTKHNPPVTNFKNRTTLLTATNANSFIGLILAICDKVF